MMFKDDYKNQIDNIKPDGYIKQKILKRIESNQKPKQETKILIFRTITAVAMIAVMFVSLFAVDSFIKNPSPVAVEEPTQVTYEDIYKALKKINNTKTNGELYEYITEDAIDMSDADAGTSKPTANKNSSSSNIKGDASDVSDTNEQVKGVDEADIVKTDGKYIYIYSPKKLAISIVSTGKEAKKVSQIELEEKGYYFNNEMFVTNGRLVLLTRKTVDNKSYTTAMIYNVEAPEKPEKLYECRQSGEYNTARLIGNTLYLISDYRVNTNAAVKEKYDTYVPVVKAKDVDGPVSAECIYAEDLSSSNYTVICGYSIQNGKLLGTQSVLGRAYTVYCSHENIITASYEMNGATKIVRYALNDGNIELKAQGEIKGSLLNQFSIDEHNGYFRFVTTENEGVEKREDKVITYSFSTVNSLRVLDENLKEVGNIENIAPEERVYSVRFMGDTAYFVTFRQVDPLFSVDLKNPKEPKIIGALKIPGFSNYLFPFGEGKLLGIGQDADENTGRTGGIKLSLFDISNPANVTESAKTILKYRDSNALYNHKASLVDTKRSLVGLPFWWEGKMQYNLYTFKNGAFELVVEFKIEQISDFIRGLYIGDEFYVVTDSVVLIHNINTLEKIASIEL